MEDAMPGIRLAPKETPDKPDQTAKNWHERIWNLFPSEVLGKEEVPPPSPPVTALRVDYSARGRSLGWLEIARAGAPPTAATSTAEKQPMASSEIFGRSEFSAGWVKLPGDAANLISEGETLAGKK
jgi:hypothetical protein